MATVPVAAVEPLARPAPDVATGGPGRGRFRNSIAVGLFMGPAAIVPAGQNDGERTGNHRREGIFLLAGAGARRGVALPTLDICDVAPTLLYLLDVPVQQDMDGAVAQGAIAPELLAARDVRTDQLAAPAEVAATEMSDQDRRAIEGMLEGLGYL